MLPTIKCLSKRTTAGTADPHKCLVEEMEPRVIVTAGRGCGWSRRPLCRDKFRRGYQYVIAKRLHRAPGAADGTKSRFFYGLYMQEQITSNMHFFYIECEEEEVIRDLHCLGQYE